MDALRSIPDSVAAARAGLRHVVRELLNGKVQISYIGPDADPTPTRMAAAPSASSSAHGSGPVPNDKLPSPWGFVTSGYALGLLLMAIILNRIAHVVVPPRQTGRRRQPRRIWHALFPINVSATHTRLISRAPSIALLGTALFLLLIALVQAAGIWEPLATKPKDGTWSGMWYVRACRWAAGKEMSFVCWATYIAVCVAMVMNTLTTGLEGGGTEGSHSFNLFGYSFLLHIYASPIMHIQTPKQPLPTEDMPPSRPDKHVLITIILPLLQLTILHILAVNKRWSRQRLIPTTICGLLSILHFAYVTLFSASSYPFFTYLNSLLESFLVGVILLTCTLHFTTRLLLQGQIALNPFSEDGGIAHQSLLPSRADDYAVALLKLGSACIEATAMAGFGNEVLPIHTPDTLYITQSGVPSIPNSSGLHGFAREIKNVHALEHDLGSTSAWFDAHWTREGWKFLRRISALGRGMWGMVWRRCRRRRYGTGDDDDDAKAMKVAARTKLQVREVEDVHAMYARYLLGQVVLSDDEDDEFRFEEVEDVSGSESELSDEEGSDVDGGVDADVSAPELYADLARRSLPPRSRHNTRSPSPPAGTSSALTPMLIAHLTTPARSAPLTRHRYTQLSRPEPDSAWLARLRDVRSRGGQGQGAVGSGDDDPRRNCVVCTVEPRADGSGETPVPVLSAERGRIL